MIIQLKTRPHPIRLNEEKMALEPKAMGCFMVQPRIGRIMATTKPIHRIQPAKLTT